MILALIVILLLFAVAGGVFIHPLLFALVAVVILAFAWDYRGRRAPPP